MDKQLAVWYLGYKGQKVGVRVFVNGNYYDISADILNKFNTSGLNIWDIDDLNIVEVAFVAGKYVTDSDHEYVIREVNVGDENDFQLCEMVISHLKKVAYKSLYQTHTKNFKKRTGFRKSNERKGIH